MNIFNIGKANERITALEAELKDAKEQADKLEKAATENATEVEKAAEALKKERDDFKAKLDAESTAHAITKQQLEKANADLKAAKDELAGVPEKIKTEAAKGAAAIAQAQGIPPIKDKGNENPAGTAKVELKGRERARAAFLKDISNFKSQKA